MATISLLRFAPLPPRHTRPSLSVNTTLLRPNSSIKIRPRLPPISASSTVPSTDRLPPISASNTDRLLSFVSYTYTLLNNLYHCRFLISRYPLLASLFSPVAEAYRKAWVAYFVVWIVLRFGVPRTPHISGYLRLNSMQAVMLDGVLTLAVIVLEAFGTPPGVRVLQFGYWPVFVLGFASFVYNVLCCVVGRTPYLPFVSSLAKSRSVYKPLDLGWFNTWF